MSQDDTAAIRDAIASGGRESAAKPATVFFPAGDYLVSSVLDIHSNTQLIGDRSGTPSGPNLITTPDFAGEAVLSTEGREYSPLVSNVKLS